MSNIDLLVALAGLVAAVLLLAALTGENVSSRMEAFPTLPLPRLPTHLPTLVPPGYPEIPTIPAVPQVPPLLPTATVTVSPTPLPPGPPATQAPAREPAPGRTEPAVTTPATSVPPAVNATATVTPGPTTPGAPNVTATPGLALERTSPASWILWAAVVGIGLLLLALGAYDYLKPRKK